MADVLYSQLGDRAVPAKKYYSFVAARHALAHLKLRADFCHRTRQAFATLVDTADVLIRLSYSERANRCCPRYYMP